jgi:hypothetical protein
MATKNQTNFHIKKFTVLLLEIVFCANYFAQNKPIATVGDLKGQKIVADDREEGDNFGWSTAIYGDYAVVGTAAKRKKVSQTLLEDVGAAYVYKKDAKGNWLQFQKLEDNVIKTANYFGSAVAINDKYIAVGAHGDDDSKENDFMMRNGTVHLFMLKGGKYNHIQKLEIRDKGKQDNLGYAVAMSEKFLVIGCPGRNLKDKKTDVTGNGAVYVYIVQAKGGWLPFQEIPAPDDAGFWFGGDVAINGNNIVVGTGNSGSVFVYELNNENKWALKNTLKNETKAVSFGNALGINSNRIFVGAEGDFDMFEGVERPNTDSVMQIMNETADGRFESIGVPNNAKLRDSFGIKPSQFAAMAKPVESIEMRKKNKAGAGEVHVYKKNEDGTFSFEEKLQPKGISADDHFGMSISVSDSVALFGAFGDKLPGKEGRNNFYAGAVYQYKLKEGKWVEVKKITAAKRTAWMKFGFSVGVWKNEGIIGSRFEATDAKEKFPKKDAGAAYIYDLK